MTMHYWSVRDVDGNVLRSGYTHNRHDIKRQAVNPGEVAKREKGPVTVPVPERVVTAAQVKAHAGRLLSYTDWVVVKALDTGEPADPAVIAKRHAVRAASNQIEAMDPIPADFTDPKYWPEQP